MTSDERAAELMSEDDLVELYVFLRRNDRGLPEQLEAVRDRLERALYARMSIAEMEELEQKISQVGQKTDR